MPRQNKSLKRQKVNAAAEFRKGNRKEAYKIWEEANKALKEMRDKKRNRNQPVETEES